MRKDILQVVTQGVRSKRKHLNLQGMARLTVTKGFNEPSNSIEIDCLSGLSNVQHRETALISIDFADGQKWSGTFAQLQNVITDAVFSS